MSGRPILGPTPSRRQQSFRIRLPDEIPPVEQHPRCQGSAAAGGLPPAHLWTPPAIAGAGGAHRWTAGPGPGPWTAQRRRGSFVATYAAAQPDHRPSARRPPHAPPRDRLCTGRTFSRGIIDSLRENGLCTSSVISCPSGSGHSHETRRARPSGPHGPHVVDAVPGSFVFSIFVRQELTFLLEIASHAAISFVVAPSRFRALRMRSPRSSSTAATSSS